LFFSKLCDFFIGKQNVKSLKHNNIKELNRQARKNLLTQIRKKKREEIIAQKRNIGSFSSAPILICIIPLQHDIDVKNVISNIKDAHEDVSIVTSPCGNVIHIG
jgi:pre-rRNA-processing protein TSR1